MSLAQRLRLGASDTQWMRDARCRGQDPEIFFPDRGDGGVQLRWLRETFCDHCPVKADCLEYAIVNLLDHGCWGGESERTRRRMRAARKGLTVVK